MTKEIIIITLLLLVIYLYWQNNQVPSATPEHLSLIKDLKKQVQHYQNLYQKRVEKDLDKKDQNIQTDNSGIGDKEIQTDLNDKQVSNLISQWNQVAEWATEAGIDINSKWNLGMLKGKLGQEKEQWQQEKEEWKKCKKWLEDELDQLEERGKTLNKELEKEWIKSEKMQEEETKMLEIIANVNEVHDNFKNQIKELIKEKKKLEQELANKNNWNNDNLPQLKEELFSQAQNIYQELKGQIEKATMAWGRKEVEEKLKELDKCLNSGRYSLYFPPQTKQTQTDLETEVNQHQEQLRQINLLFNPSAANYENIDFNGLYSLLQQIAERERERERANRGMPGDWPKKD